MSKGDTYRPVNQQKWADNYDRIFRKTPDAPKIDNETPGETTNHSPEAGPDHAHTQDFYD